MGHKLLVNRYLRKFLLDFLKFAWLSLVLIALCLVYVAIDIY